LSPHRFDDDNDMSTIPDPRGMSPAFGDAMASPHHPDLDQEVATLSTKLINAINHTTTLDDNLSATRAELENAREKIRQLELRVEEQREMLAGDVWVKRKSVESEKAQLLARIAEEKKARAETELQKKKIEQELENLTTALFEEANKMVITAKEEARQEHEALQRKNDQLRAQIADTELLLKSQNEQLAELKDVLQQMTAEQEEQSSLVIPSSPGVSQFDAQEDHPAHAVQHHGLPDPSSPSYPTSFTHLLQPVLRTDLASYADFKDLIRTSKRLSGQRFSSVTAPPAMVSLGIGLGSIASQASLSNASNSSLSTVATSPASSPQTPVTPGSASSIASAGIAGLLPHLKETKFYKRVLTEDIEPTLRLDIAPGISWIARSRVMTAMTEGSLVVEPMPAASTGRFGRAIKPELSSCALCGESGQDEKHLRTHRFRISENGSAQSGYPLCNYCLARVRSTCDFLSFLRVVKDGHWRADDEDAEKAAWEESVRLREQMFWTRIGGGVIPSAHHLPPASAAPSPRPSVESEQKTPEPEQPAEPLTDVSLEDEPEKKVVVEDTKIVIPQEDSTKSEDAQAEDTKTITPQLPEETTLEVDSQPPAAEPPTAISSATELPAAESPAAVTEDEQPKPNIRDSTHSLDTKTAIEAKHLSLTIPAAS